MRSRELVSQIGKLMLVLCLVSYMGATWLPNEAQAETDDSEELDYRYESSIPEKTYAFNVLTEVSTDAEGYIYVMDANNPRIVKLTPEGETSEVWMQTEGFMPSAMTVDEAGYVYVINSYSNQLLKLDMALTEPVEVWNTEELGYIDELAVDGNAGIIYAVDSDQTLIWRLDLGYEGSWSSWDQYSTGEVWHSFANPIDIAVDSEGSVYVAEDYNRVLKLDAHGDYEAQVIQAEELLGRIGGIALDREGLLYVTDRNNDSVVKFDSEGNIQASFGESGIGAGQFDSPQSIAIGKEGMIYVADSYNNRIQLWNSELEYEGSWGTYGTETGQFLYPEGIAIDSDGYVYVADQGNERIQQFDNKLNFVGVRGGDGGEGTFQPSGIAIDADNNVYVTSYSSLYKFNAESGAVQLLYNVLNDPRAAAVDADGNIYIANTGGHSIIKLDPSGERLLDIVGEIDEYSYYFSPQSIAVDSVRGMIYVTDSTHIQTFDLEGNQLDTAWGEPENGGFDYLTGIALDSLGNVYVTDANRDRIQKFNPSGELIAAWGTNGTNGGQFRGLGSIAVDKSGNVFVVDEENQRVQKFAYTGDDFSEPGGGEEPGGGGENGGGGGGSAVVTSPDSDDAGLKATVDGQAGELLLRSAEVNRSEQLLEITLNVQSIQELLAQKPQPASLKLQVSDSSKRIKLIIPGALAAYTNNDASLEVETPYGSVFIRLADVAGFIDPSTEQLEIELSEADEQTARNAMMTLSAEGASLPSESLVRLELSSSVKGGSKRGIILSKGYIEYRLPAAKLNAELPADEQAGVAFDLAGEGKDRYGVPVLIQNGAVVLKLKKSGWVTVVSHKQSFTDIESVPYAHEAIEALANKFIINGIGDNQFNPRASMTRAEFVSMIIKALGIHTLDGSGALTAFKDVDSGKWYANAIAESYKLGLVQGNADGNFRPDAVLNRQEMVTILFNVLKFNGMLPTQGDLSDTLAAFRDEAAIAGWAREPIAYARELGIVQGNAAGSFSPLEQANRAQGAIVIYKMLRTLGLIMV